MNNETVTITKKRYDELCEMALKLEALEQTGVDNWNGYDYAMEILDEIRNDNN